MRLILLTSIGLAALAGPTAAVAQTADWTGPYIGGRLGLTTQPKDSDETIQFDTNLDGSFDDTVNTVSGANAFQRGFCGGAAVSATANTCSDRNGTEWAVHAGYDRQIGGSLVVGAVVEYGRAYIRDSVTAFSSTPAFYTLTRSVKNTGSLRVRAGLTFGETLAYATGGIAYGKIRSSFTTSNAVNTFALSGTGDDAWGHRVGGGLERRISSRFSIGAQYLFTSLKDDGISVRVAGSNVPVSNPFILRNAEGTDLKRSSRRFNSNSVSVLASLRF